MVPTSDRVKRVAPRGVGNDLSDRPGPARVGIPAQLTQDHLPQRRREVLPKRLRGNRDCLSQMARHKRPQRPCRQGSEQLRMPLQRGPEVDRDIADDEVEKDVCSTVWPTAIGNLSGKYRTVSASSDRNVRWGRS